MLYMIIVAALVVICLLVLGVKKLLKKDLATDVSSIMMTSGME